MSATVQERKAEPQVETGPPLGMLAELTHRCPLQCPYCSNPLDLLKADSELDTSTWLSVFDQAADLGILQIHLSGGEPTVRQDLERLVGGLAKRGIYTNLITAGVTLTEARIHALKQHGLDHIQLSLQGVDAAVSDTIGNIKDGLARKLHIAALIKQAGFPLTINAPTHRLNIGQTSALIDLAVDLGAERLEIAHVQYYGWAAINKAALMPDYSHVLEEAAIVAEARERLRGVLTIDYVTPDHYAQFPKPCMGGWARDAFTVTPAGQMLPCHAAQTLPLTFANVKTTPLASIWYESEAFNRFRGFDWMKEPCRTCPRKEIDFGGCRCQALALAGDPDATDPACSLSPDHTIMAQLTKQPETRPPFQYRKMALCGFYPRDDLRSRKPLGNMNARLNLSKAG